MNNEQLIEAVETASANFRSAMIRRDAIESCVSPEWRAAHKEAKDLCEVRDQAYKAAWKAGAIQKPYWAR